MEAFDEPDPAGAPEPTYKRRQVYRVTDSVPLELPGTGALGLIPVIALMSPAEQPAPQG